MTKAKDKARPGRDAAQAFAAVREQGARHGRRRWGAYMLAFVLGAGAAAGAAALLCRNVPGNVRSAPAAGPNRSLGELLGRDPKDLEAADIAEMNLLCAEGLPGSEGLDPRRCLARLDAWAARVRAETERHLYRWRQNPAAYNGSEGYFRMLMLVTVLQQDFGVHYSKDRVREVDFRNAKDLFIHGMIDDPNGGTCVSMPVLYAAVGRRLGYPVRLVLAKGHVFCRWDAPDDRVNVEATNQGVNSFDDAYYKTWPQAMTTAEAASGRYLRSLTAAEELAVFLAARGHCLEDTGRLPEARLAYAQAHRIDPKAPEYLGFLAEAMRTGPGRLAGSGQRPQRDPLEELRRVEAINAANRRLTEPPMPGGAPPAPVPGEWAQPGRPPVRPGRVLPQPVTPSYPAPPQAPPP